MVRTVDYEARRRAVLGVAINRYIKDAAPVSSEDIAREFNLSPATIRNIFVDLEKSGYLTHPHTSSGRVPTDKGYRQYVDFLSSQLELLDGEKKSIVKHFEREISRLEDALEETSEVISAITHYTSIVSFLDWQERLFYKGMNFILEQPEFQDFRRLGLIIKMIEERQQLLNIINRDFKEKVRVYIGEVGHGDNIHKGQHKPTIDKKLWNEANRLLKLHAPLRKNPKRETKYIFVLQGLVKCGKCGNYMTSKYSTGRNGLHPYYQCTRNAHGGKDACDMKYVPAAEFEKAILEKIKDMCEDKKRLQEIVKKANRSTESALRSLKQDRKIQENKLKPIANSIKHILDALSKGIKNKSVSEKLSELEIQKDQIEKDIQNIDFEMDRVKQQILNAKVMYESLIRFRQIYETKILPLSRPKLREFKVGNFLKTLTLFNSSFR